VFVEVLVEVKVVYVSLDRLDEEVVALGFASLDKLDEEILALVSEMSTCFKFLANSTPNAA